MILPNVVIYSTVDAAQHPRRPESSELWQ